MISDKTALTSHTKKAVTCFRSLLFCAYPKAQSEQKVLKEALIKSLSYFVISIMMQDKEKDDANSEAI